MSEPRDPGPYAGPLATALPAAAREIEQFVGSGGWDQPPQLFALVPTAALLASRPELSGQVDDAAPLTPVAQDQFPEGELDEALAGIEWPEGVAGCALAQEIVVLPPGAQQGPGEPPDELPADPEQARRVAAARPDRQEGRLVAAVLREGAGACVLRVRGAPGAEDAPEGIIEHAELAPNLVRALLATLS